MHSCYISGTWFVHYCAQELGKEVAGTCTDFQAVPGHGLRCHVGDMEEHVGESEWKYSKLMSRDECVSSRSNFMAKDIELEAATRKYSVSLHVLYVCSSGISVLAKE